jgi:hypothetical protein
MPYIMVPPRSDRGSIKDIQNRKSEHLEDNPDMPPTEGELRMKSLYEHAMVTKDQAMIEALGLIVMGGAANDPVALLRHKEYVKELTDRMAPEIEKAKEELSACLVDTVPKSIDLVYNVIKQAEALNTILSDTLVKTASTQPRRSFWRNK